MKMATVEDIRHTLREVNDPELGQSLIHLEMVKTIQVTGEVVCITLALTTLACPLKDRIVEDVKRVVLALPGVSRVEVDLVAMSPEERARVIEKANLKKDEPSPAQELNHIKRVVAVMSGKGGVGKSLVTSLLALALVRRGTKVGILDADVTGPSIPKIFGLRTRPEVSPFWLLPVCTKLGIRIMSINLLLEREDDAVIWRGPLISGAIKQFWGDVIWGDLDYLLVDLPPGTADAPLTVMQSLPVSGVVLVSTPQDLAGMVVRKAMQMVQKLNKPILGVVENMSYFVCPDTGKRHYIFGPSRGEEMARVAEAPLLATLPIDPELARLCDAGQIEEYESAAYQSLAEAFIGADSPATTYVAQAAR